MLRGVAQHRSKQSGEVLAGKRKKTKLKMRNMRGGLNGEEEEEEEHEGVSVR